MRMSMSFSLNVMGNFAIEKIIDAFSSFADTNDSCLIFDLFILDKRVRVSEIIAFVVMEKD